MPGRFIQLQAFFFLFHLSFGSKIDDHLRAAPSGTTLCIAGRSAVEHVSEISVAEEEGGTREIVPARRTLLAFSPRTTCKNNLARAWERVRACADTRSSHQGMHSAAQALVYRLLFHAAATCHRPGSNGFHLGATSGHILLVGLLCAQTHE